MSLQKGSKAPNFRAQNESGEWLELSAYCAMEPVVLYFYPKDHTETCTKQACAFQESISEFRNSGVQVLGISPDTPESHARFRKDYSLDFSLLADPDHKICELYDVWKEKTLYGRTYMGVVRTTFIIDTKRRIYEVFENVRLKGHIDSVLQSITKLKGQ